MIAVLLFPLILYLPGLVAYRVFWHGRRWLWRGSPAEAAYIQFLIGGLYVAMAGLILAQLGRFSLLTILVATLIPSVIVIIARRDCFGLADFRSYQLNIQGERHSPLQNIKTFAEPIAVAALLLLAIFLFARPGEMIRGAADAGIYVNSGAHIAEHGSIFILDPIIRDMSDDEIRQYFVGLSPDRYTLTRQRASGFYIYDKKATLVIPQHYTLYSIWLAIFYAVTGGPAGELYATPYLMLLALASVYFAGKRMFGAIPAWFGALLLALNTTEVWFARYSVAEAGTQFLGFAAFYCFAVFVSTQRRLDNVTTSKGRSATSQNAALGRQGAINHAPTDANSVGAQFIAPSTAPSTAPPVSPPVAPPSYTPPDTEIADQTAVVRGFGVLTALSLGEIFFIRPDFVFYLLPVPLYLGWLLLTRRWRPIHWWLFLPLLAMLMLAIVHIFFFTYPYTFDLFHNTLIDQRRLWARNFALLYGGVIVLALLWWLLQTRPRWARPVGGLFNHYWPRVRPWLLALLALGAGAYMVNVYIFKPHLITLSNVSQLITHPSNFAAYVGAPVPFNPALGPTDNHQELYNMVKVGWYFSPLGIVLATFGLMLTLWRKLTLKSAYFFLMLAISLVVFVGETYSDPHYIYTMRRYIPIVTPAFSLFIGYLCWELFSWGRNFARRRNWRLAVSYGAQFTAAAFYLAQVVFFVYTIRPIFSHVEDQGAIAQISSLAQKLPANSVTIMSADRDTPYVVLTPLRFIYDRDVLSLSQDYQPAARQPDNTVIASSIKRWMAAGKPIYVMLGSNGGKLDLPGYDFTPIEEWKYSVPEFEQLYYQKPYNISNSSLQYGLYRVTPRTVTPTLQLPFSVDMGGDFDYPYTVSGWFDKENDSNGVSYRWTGPNATLRLPAPSAPGPLTVTLSLSAGPPQRCSAAPNRTAPAQFGLYYGNTPVGLTTLPVACRPAPADNKPQPATFTQIQAHLTVTTLPADGWLYLTLRATPWQPAADTPGADARQLGVQVDQIKIERLTRSGNWGALRAPRYLSAYEQVSAMRLDCPSYGLYLPSAVGVNHHPGSLAGYPCIYARKQYPQQVCQKLKHRYHLLSCKFCIL